MIIADVHEPEEYRKMADEVRELQVDYIVVGSERKYMVERKTVTDLWKSVIDGRLWRQLSYMEEARKEGYVPILLVEGSWGSLFKFARTITPIKLMGIQLAFSSFGVSVVNVPSYWVRTFIQFLDKKSNKKRTFHRPTIPKPIERTLRDERLDVLCSVRGIGEKTAERILERFGSIYLALTSDESDIREVLGKKTDHFLEVFKGVDEN